MMMMKLPMSLA